MLGDDAFFLRFDSSSSALSFDVLIGRTNCIDLEKEKKKTLILGYEFPNSNRNPNRVHITLLT